MLDTPQVPDLDVPASAVFASQHVTTATSSRSPSKATALFSAAHALLPVLEAGETLSTSVLRTALTTAFGADDSQGAWSWKDAYDASETATVLFLRRWGQAMRTYADSPRRMLHMLDALAALEPSHTRRSEEQQQLQQFSTPLSLAYAAAVAAACQPDDIVLEPSAGTGVLAAMTLITGTTTRGPKLHLNELATTRTELLQRLFPNTPISHHNAEAIADHLPTLNPTVVVMNPPFSVSPHVHQRMARSDLRHLCAAFSMLPPGGRLVAITSSNCTPRHDHWKTAFRHTPTAPHVAFSIAIEGRVYARRGTTFDTRLTVLEHPKNSSTSLPCDFKARISNVADLLDAIEERLSPRLPIARNSTNQTPQTDLFTPPVRSPSAPLKLQKAETRCPDADPDSATWGSIAELEYSTLTTVKECASEAHGPQIYETWRPRTVHIEGAHPHPTPLVQSGSMNAVPHPIPYYRPLLPIRVIRDGLLSDAQLESVILAGQAHEQHLATEYRVDSDWETMASAANEDPTDGEAPPPPVRLRKGWMLGDGTGTGKGRQVAGILLDHWLRGRRRALWLSQSDKLIEDARRDWVALGGCASDIIPLGKFRQGATISVESAIMFSTYATLRSPARQARRSRLDQLVAWLAGGLHDQARHSFDGVVVFDECHALANAAGSKSNRGEVAPSQQGRAGLRLQHALPDARVLYASATGASTVSGLAYAQRLGLWDAGDTPFEHRTAFVSAMEAGGVAAMEVVARDCKALGVYQARALSFEGVEVDMLEHVLSDEQRRIYNSYANVFTIIHTNIDSALEAAGVTCTIGDTSHTLNRRAKAAAMSTFEGTKQRFFGHLLTAMKIPSLIRAIETDLEAGHAAVVQLVSTGEALMERRINQIPPSEWHDLSVDLTPREYVLDYLAHAFPVQLHETFTDDDGNLMSRPVFNDAGDPVLSQAACAARDSLLQQLGALPPVQTALDQIIHHFGHDAVAEITGRSRRILRLGDGNSARLALHNRPASSNLAEADAFMDGTKRVLVFSQAGGTGRSYHADLTCANTARRIHYLLESGWRADQAIQGLGRTHRTHQACAPLFRPITTDVKGERRFISTILRRLDSLGAITRGHRDSQSSMGDGARMFRPEDNFESSYAKSALRLFYLDLYHDRIPDWGVAAFERATGLSLTHDGGLREELPPMFRCLNRLLALPIDQQNQLFEVLENHISNLVAQAMEARTYDRGVEVIHADSLILSSRESLFVHQGSGATTEICEIERRDKLEPLTVDSALAIAERTEKPRMMINERSNRAALVLPHASLMREDGDVEARVRLLRPGTRETLSKTALEDSHWRSVETSAWQALWEQEIAGLPSHTISRFWLVTGLLLPIWDRLPPHTMRVRRLLTDAGERMIGRVLAPAEVTQLRSALGLTGGPSLTSDELREEVLTRGTSFAFVNDWRLTRRRIADADRIEIEGPRDHDIDALKRLGCVNEIVAYQTRVFVPDEIVLARVVDRHPLRELCAT